MITFLILKYDIIENSRIELGGIVVPVQVGGLLGGPKGMLVPPLSNYWGGGGGLAPPAPPPPPSSYAYVINIKNATNFSTNELRFTAQATIISQGVKIFTFLVYLLKSPIVNHWNVMLLYFNNNIEPNDVNDVKINMSFFSLVGRRRCSAVRRKTARKCFTA